MSLYTPLPEGSVRLLKLLPHSDEHPGIRCRLFTCNLLDSGSIHPYEALSYVWGPDVREHSIHVNNYELSVRANLYAALSHLRDRFIKRIIWVDAICINQDDEKDEKEKQVLSMAKIYAKASHVIVWLGEATADSIQALNIIRDAAEQQHTNSTIAKTNPQVILTPPDQQPTNSTANETNQAILRLLDRPWFRRIWVLQEVAAARYVLIKCGPIEIDGYAFCSGLNALNLSYEERPDLQGLIPPITSLMRDTIFRSRYVGGERGQPSRFFLDIRPLSELVDMYHTREATNPLDKVYALLGMSKDDPYAAGLSPNYRTSWKDVFQNLVKFSLSDRMFVDTWETKNVAVVEGKGHVLREVSSAEKVDTRDDRQSVGITWKNTRGYFSMKEKQSSQLTIQASAKPIQAGDSVCLLQGASRPTIVRLSDGFSTIVMIAVPLTNDLQEWLESIITFPNNLLLIWDWDESQGRKDYGDFISSRGVPKCPIGECQCLDDLDKATRLWNFGLLLNRLERYKEAGKTIRKAVEVYGNAKALRRVGEPSPVHGAWREIDEEVLRVMDLINGKGAAIEAKCTEYDQTPLSWAAEEGHEAVVRLLLKAGAATEPKDKYGQTPLSCAAKNGRESVVKLLLETSKVEADSKDEGGRMPLWWAARNGHEAVVKLLLETGKVEADLKDKEYGQTPLSCAAENGHEAVVKLLLETGKVEADSKNKYGRTPLSWAAENKHEAVVNLLSEHIN